VAVTLPYSATPRGRSRPPGPSFRPSERTTGCTVASDGLWFVHQPRFPGDRGFFYETTRLIFRAGLRTVVG
jgi:hypothetical protein